MALAPGTRLGPYDILAAIGAGGMGDVYRGRDTRLNRDVAIKVLPDLSAADADSVARFEREARTLAALNHPNIAIIHGFEESPPAAGSGDAPIRALILELVEGPTLAERIEQGPLPLDEALPIARQIAEACEAAHAQGIVHRDLKPANIKLRRDGTVKVLDFGIAKLVDPVPGAAPAAGADDGATVQSVRRVWPRPDVTSAPTVATPARLRDGYGGQAMTMAGMILGTAAYMSPEQARGKTIDKRADIWAFGCVLFEMLSGTRAFGGADITDTLAFVITRSRTGTPYRRTRQQASSDCCAGAWRRNPTIGCAILAMRESRSMKRSRIRRRSLPRLRSPRRRAGPGPASRSQSPSSVWRPRSAADPSGCGCGRRPRAFRASASTRLPLKA